MVLNKTNRTIYRRSVLDINPDIAVGVSLPFNGPAVFNSTYTVRDQIKSNLINLVLTYPGERINEPNFGVGLKKYLFEKTIDKETLLEEISNQSSIYLPEVEIQDLTLKNMPEENTIQCNIIYKVTVDETTENLQLNFNQ